jgi:penicillin-binding protein 1C
LTLPGTFRVVALWASLALGSASALAELPSFEAVRDGEVSSDTRVLDRHGEWLQRLRSNPNRRQGAWVRLDQISPALRNALLLSEDRRFYEHAGVDWQAAAAAAWGRLWHNRTRGASTITMQLAGLIDDELRLGPGGRSWGQKLGQVVTARELESRWRKDQILEAYLSLVPFRGELVGIDALSRSLFGKAPHGLNNQEAALAAALVRAPNAAPERVAERTCSVLQSLHAQQKMPAPDCAPLRWSMAGWLQRRDWVPSDGIAPHAARRALAQAAGDRALFHPGSLTTTLWAPLQRQATELLKQQLRELHSQRVQDGAVLVLDNASGEVLAWVGSSGALSEAPEVDAVLALRQPGSTLKPFLYAQAIAQRRLTAASLIEDAPTHIATPSGLYIPQNYDRHFQGWVSVRTALGASLNTPAVRTLAMVSPDRFHEQLNALGLDLRETGGYFGLGLALGSAEVSLLRLSNASAHPGAQAPGRTPVSRSSCAGSCRQLHRGPHPERQQRPRRHVRHRQRARHPFLDRRENGHQQRHARQLDRGLVGALHRGRMGGQRQRCAHGPGQRFGGRRAHLGRRDAMAAHAGATASVEPGTRPPSGLGRANGGFCAATGSAAPGMVHGRHRASADAAQRHRLPPGVA